MRSSSRRYRDQPANQDPRPSGRAPAHQLLLSIGGLVGQVDLTGAPDVFWEQLRARYGAFLLPPSAQVARDFVLRLDMVSVPLPTSRAAILRRYAETEAHPLAVEATGRKLAATRWDFDVVLTGRAGRGGRTVYRGDGRCEMSPFALDTVLRVIFATLLPRAGGMLIHACGLRHASVGVIFPGQSGAGKTTLARKAPDADDVLSDEIVAVRRLDDGWRVFGTPFWGDFARGGISMRSWPLRTVAFLTQTREMGMTPITSSDATLRLLGCFMSFAVDRASVERSLAIAIQLCAEVRSVEAGPDPRRAHARRLSEAGAAPWPGRDAADAARQRPRAHLRISRALAQAARVHLSTARRDGLAESRRRAVRRGARARGVVRGRATCCCPGSPARRPTTTRWSVTAPVTIRAPPRASCWGAWR